MVSTRSKASNTVETGDKREAPSTTASGSGGAKRAKKDKNGKLEVGDDGEVGLKKEEREGKVDEKVNESKVDVTEPKTEDNTKQDEPKAEKEETTKDVQGTKEENVDEEDQNAEGRTRSGPGETKQEVRFFGPDHLGLTSREMRLTTRLEANRPALISKSLNMVSHYPP